jgi:hypothetical protein
LNGQPEKAGLIDYLHGVEERVPVNRTGMLLDFTSHSLLCDVGSSRRELEIGVV